MPNFSATWYSNFHMRCQGIRQYENILNALLAKYTTICSYLNKKFQLKIMLVSKIKKGRQCKFNRYLPSNRVGFSVCRLSNVMENS